MEHLSDIDELKERKRNAHREYMREYSRRPEVKAKAREYYTSPEVLEHRRERYRIPEIRERKLEYQSERRALPEVKERRKEYFREYSHRPEVIKHRYEHWHTPEMIERQRGYERKSNSRPGVKERRAEQKREYFSRPEVKERMAKYSREVWMKHPRYLAHTRRYNRDRRWREKAQMFALKSIKNNYERLKLVAPEKALAFRDEMVVVEGEYFTRQVLGDKAFEEW